MPIDPNIALQARAPEMPDVVGQYGRLMTLQNMLKQGQMQDIQMETAQVERQQAQMQMKELDDFNQALKASARTDEDGNVTIDDDAVMTSLAKSGAGQRLLTYREQLSKATKEQLATEEQRLKTNSAKAGRLGQLAQSAIDQETYVSAVSQAAREGIIPQDQLATMPADFTQAKPMLQQFISSTMNAKELLDYQAKLAEEEHKKKTRPLEEKKLTQEITGTVPLTEAQRQQYGKMDRNKALDIISDPKSTEEQKTKANNFLIQTASQEGREAAEKEKGQMGAAGGAEGAPYTGFAAGGAEGQRNEKILIGQPTGMVATVKAMIDGRMPIPTGAALRQPYWQRVLNLAAQYEPGFDATQWRVRLDTRADFAKGNSARQIRALNTLIKHLGSVWDSIDTLDNMKLKMGNRVWNWLRSEAGSEALKPWQTSATAAASEMATLLKGGAAPSQPEIAEQEEAFNINDSKEAQRQAVLSTLELAFGRFDAIKEQWNNAFRKPADFKFINPNARKTLTKFGINPDEIDAATGPAAAGAGETTGYPNAPTVGTVSKGYRFKGGDPSQQDSWEKVK